MNIKGTTGTLVLAVAMTFAVGCATGGETGGKTGDTPAEAPGSEPPVSDASAPGGGSDTITVTVDGDELVFATSLTAAQAERVPFDFSGCDPSAGSGVFAIGGFLLDDSGELVAHDPTDETAGFAHVLINLPLPEFESTFSFEMNAPGVGNEGSITLKEPGTEDTWTIDGTRARAQLSADSGRGTASVVTFDVTCDPS